MASCSAASSSSSSDSHTYVSVYVYSMSDGCSFFGLALGSTDDSAAAGLFTTCWDFGLGFASATFGSAAASVFGFVLDRSTFSSRVLFSFLSSLAALSSASLCLRLIRASSCSNFSLFQLFWSWIHQRQVPADVVDPLSSLNGNFMAFRSWK